MTSSSNGSNNGVSVISRIAGGVIVNNDSQMLRKVSPPVIVDEWYDVNIRNQRLFLAIAKHNENVASGFNPN